MELLALVIKQQENNFWRQPGHQSPAVATTEPVPEVALAQCLGLQKPGCQQSQTRHMPRTEKTHYFQPTCNFASVQAQLSELQKMFCQLSEPVNVNKSKVEPYTGLSSSGSKLTNPKRYVETEDS